MCPESSPKRSEIPKCPVWLSLSALAQLCSALHCNIWDFTAEICLDLEKIQILFIAQYFLLFYYSVICSEKLEKSVLDKVQMKFFSYQCVVRCKPRWQQIKSEKKPGSYIMYTMCWNKRVFEMIMSLSPRPALPWSWTSGAGVTSAALYICWSFSLLPFWICLQTVMGSFLVLPHILWIVL